MRFGLPASVPPSRSLSGEKDDFSLSLTRRAFLVVSVAGAMGVSYRYLMDQAKQSDQRVAEQKRKEALDREHTLRDIWQQPDGDLVIGAEYEVPLEGLFHGKGSEKFLTARISFRKTGSGTALVLNGISHPLTADTGLSVFGFRAPLGSVFVSRVRKSGSVLIIDGAGLAGLMPGSSIWNREMLAEACRELRGGERVAYPINRTVERGAPEKIITGFIEPAVRGTSDSAVLADASADPVALEGESPEHIEAVSR